jgi:2-C-methyl-D-erythritol 4-phosphate cytidylyltransferase
LGLGPKAFIDLNGKTLLERALDNVHHADIVHTIIAVSEDMATRAHALVGDKASIIIGGSSRQETVYQLLQQTDTEAVLIHDAARPFLPNRIIADILTRLASASALIVAKSVADTLLQVSNGQTINRDELRAVQTPQAFHRDLILEAHRTALNNHSQATDDAGLVRQLGKDVGLVSGSPWLFKITHAEDLAMARALAPFWDSHGA